MFQVWDTRSGKIVAQDATGVFPVHDQRVYTVQSEGRLPQGGRFLKVQPAFEGKVGTLCFDNYVGLAEVAGLRFCVQHSKLTPEAFGKLLDQVVAEVADLAFDYASPTALPFEREDLTASPEVLYHALAYLRHVMLRAPEGRLLGQFLQIARHPHRRMEPESGWMPVERAASLRPDGLLAVASHPERWASVPPGTKLAETGLGRLLGKRRPMFPAEVRLSEHAESFDTHENRLVLHVLRLTSDIITAFESRESINPDLRTEVRAMGEEIDWMLSFDFLGDVGPMQFVPSQSSVLQRRDGYREFLGHFIRLSQSSILGEHLDRWHALLDLKDGSLLYELWCFFEVKRTLDDLVGKPQIVNLVATEEERRRVPWSAKAVYHDGRVELIYNLSYRRPSGSYSVTLRPDVVVRVKRAAGWEALILDAKLKFEGERLHERGDRDPLEWDRSANREDLYKMHTYRDAIQEAVGAFVLYPGSKLAVYPEAPGGLPWDGIGAIPFDPSEPSEQLCTMLSAFLNTLPV